MRIALGLAARGDGAGGRHNTIRGGGSSYNGYVTDGVQTPGVNTDHGYVT